MLDHAREGVAFMAGKSRAHLDQDRMLQLALTRVIEIVGEAASRVSADGRMRYSAIPWALIVGARNRIIHGYDVVNYDRVWQIVTDEFPHLIEALEQVFPGHKS